VHVVFVNESRADKPVVLIFGFYEIRVHHQPAKNLDFVEGVKANGSGNANENDSDIHG
jgi:hypothetical protein